MAMLDYAPLHEARDRQAEPETLMDFAARTGVGPGEAVAVTRTALGDFAQEPNGTWVWLAI